MMCEPLSDVHDYRPIGDSYEKVSHPTPTKTKYQMLYCRKCGNAKEIKIFELEWESEAQITQ